MNDNDIPLTQVWNVRPANVEISRHWLDALREVWQWSRRHSEEPLPEVPTVEAALTCTIEAALAATRSASGLPLPGQDFSGPNFEDC